MPVEGKAAGQFGMEGGGHGPAVLHEHRGSILFESNPGRGTKVTIRLPLGPR